MNSAVKLLWAVALFGSATVASTVCLAAGESIPGYPDAIEAFDPREIAMLPGYCKYTQTYRGKIPGGNNPAEIERWTEVMGDIFNAMHHYCNGLMRTNRALLLAREPQVKRFNLSASINEFDYVIDRAPQDFSLLPEILTKKGENLLRLGNKRGIESLQRAIELNKTYWPPYAALADYYKQAGLPGDARQVLERGLAAAPGSKALTRRLNDLKSAKSSDAAR